VVEVRGALRKRIDPVYQEPKMQQSKPDKKDGKTIDDWFEYLTEGMNKEPKTTQEMMQQSFRATGRSMIFIGWVYYKTIGFMIRIIRRMLRMVFGRGKKNKDEQAEMIELPRLPPAGAPAQLPLAFEQPQPQPAQPAPPAPAPAQPAPQPADPQAQYRPPAQSAPAPPQEIQQLPAQPLPAQPAPAPQPPAQPPQQPVMVAPPPAPAPAKPEVRENPFNLMARAVKNIDERMRLVEDQIDQMIDRLNMVQGVQPMTKQRIRFSRFGGA